MVGSLSRQHVHVPCRYVFQPAEYVREETRLRVTENATTQGAFLGRRKYRALIARDSYRYTLSVLFSTHNNTGVECIYTSMYIRNISIGSRTVIS